MIETDVYGVYTVSYKEFILFIVRDAFILCNDLTENIYKLDILNIIFQIWTKKV